MSSQTQLSLGDWVDQLLHNIFFQPDDVIAAQAFENSLSPDLFVTNNDESYTFASYKDTVTGARASAHFSLDENEQLLTAPADEEGRAGSVAVRSTFTTKVKATGEEVKSKGVILAQVKWEGGKRVLVQMMEVTV